MGVNSVHCLRLLPDLNPGPSAPESSTLTTRLPSHPSHGLLIYLFMYVHTYFLFCITRTCLYLCR